MRRRAGGCLVKYARARERRCEERDGVAARNAFCLAGKLGWESSDYALHEFRYTAR